MRALRSLMKQPGHVALAVSTLGLAVGVNVVIFTVVNALWIRPAVVHEPDRLVWLVGQAGPGIAGDTDPTPLAGLWAVQDVPAFEGVAGQVLTSGQHSHARPRLRLAAVNRDVEVLGVTSEYFGVLGVPIRGRNFDASDDRIGSEPVAILSDRLWASAFGRRSGVIGAITPAAPFPVRIVGIAAPGFEGARLGERTDVWIPRNLVPRVSALGGALPENAAPLLAFARLRPGVTVAGAQALLRDFDDAYAQGRESRESLRVVPLRNLYGTPFDRSALVGEAEIGRLAAGLGALVLLAGSVRLMTLVLVEYERRRREFGLRLALGASRRRIVRQLVGELAWLSTAGIAVALLAVAWSVPLLQSLRLPGGIELGRLDLSVDWRVASAAVLITLLAMLLAGLAPIIRFTRTDFGRLLTFAAESSSVSLRIRRALLATHAAATIVILVAAGLFVRTVALGFGAGPGFDVDRTLFAVVQPLSTLVRTSEDGRALRAQLAPTGPRLFEALGGLPGVDRIALGPAPIGPAPAPPSVVVVESGTTRREILLNQLTAGPGYLEALGTPLVAGRPLTEADAAARPTPIVMTAELANLLWPGAQAVGQEITIQGRVCTVAGIARDFRYGSLNGPGAPVVIRADTLATPRPEQRFVLNTSHPAALSETARRAIAGLYPDAPKIELTTGRDAIARDLGRQQLGAWFFSGFGIVALVLGVIGTYGLVAHAVASRRHELAVMAALGGEQRHFLRMTAGAGFVPVAVGTAIGLVAAAALSTSVQSLLVGVSPLDGVTYLLIGCVVPGCAACAAALAARRARWIVPADALRTE